MLQIKGDGEKITNILIDGMKWREQYRVKVATTVAVVCTVLVIVGLYIGFSPLINMVGR